MLTITQNKNILSPVTFIALTKELFPPEISRLVYSYLKILYCNFPVGTTIQRVSLGYVPYSRFRVLVEPSGLFKLYDLSDGILTRSLYSADQVGFERDPDQPYENSEISNYRVMDILGEDFETRRWILWIQSKDPRSCASQWQIGLLSFDSSALKTLLRPKNCHVDDRPKHATFLYSTRFLLQTTFYVNDYNLSPLQITSQPLHSDTRLLGTQILSANYTTHFFWRSFFHLLPTSAKGWSTASAIGEEIGLVHETTCTLFRAQHPLPPQEIRVFATTVSIKKIMLFETGIIVFSHANFLHWFPFSGAKTPKLASIS
jgi:hypothetical protein